VPSAAGARRRRSGVGRDGPREARPIGRGVDRSRFSQAPPAPAAAHSDRSAARLLAAAAATLLVIFLVVSRSNAALGGGPANTGNSLAGSSVELTTDDEGRPLFEAVVIVPDRPVANCIAVTYRGNLVPEQVALFARGEGPLAQGLVLTVERGRGGRFGDCKGFRPEGVVYEGTLAALMTGFAPSTAGLPVMTVRASPQTTTFRFSLRLPRESAGSGHRATADFLWKAGS
jgi:hypothetical protein